MEYHIFVYGVENVKKIVKANNYRYNLKIYEAYLPSNDSEGIIGIKVGGSNPDGKFPDIKRFSSIIDSLRGLPAVVKINYPRISQTDFGLEEGEYIFSEKLFPPLFSDTKDVLVNRIKNLRSKEDYIAFLEYCSYSEGLRDCVYHKIVDRGLVYELRELIPEKFIVEENIACVLDDPELILSGPLPNHFVEQIFFYKSIKVMGYVLENGLIAEPKIFSSFPPSRKIRNLCERYNLKIHIGNFGRFPNLQILEKFRRVVYSKNLEKIKYWAKKIAKDEYDRSFLDMREVILNDPDIRKICEESYLRYNYHPHIDELSFLFC